MTYQGWSNYPTWCINLWLSNDEGMYLDVQSLIRDNRNVRDAALALEAYIEDTIDTLTGGAGDTLIGTGFTADLFNWALGQVDWYEIAEHWLKDLDDESDSDNGAEPSSI